MTIPNAELSAVLRDPLYAAKLSGRPIVLYVSNNVPVELIHASGCFALQLPTAPRDSYARADHYLEAGFEPMVRSALEQLLSAELDCASLLVLPRTIDAWQRLYYYLCELTRSFGERLPEPFLYDLQQQPRATSAAYDLASTQRLSQRLQALSGKRLQPSDVVASIALYNRVRDKLERVMRRRHEQPCHLPGAEALDLYTAVQRLAPEPLLAALDDLDESLPSGDDSAPSGDDSAEGTRTLLVGSAHDTPRLHQMIELAGGQVVADFHFRGDWTFGPRIDEAAAARDPLLALSEHYRQHSLSSRSFPLPLSALLESATRARAEAAVFFYYDEEEALTWDYPAQAAALQTRGMRTLLLPRQSYPPAREVQSDLDQFFSTYRTQGQS